MTDWFITISSGIRSKHTPPDCIHEGLQERVFEVGVRNPFAGAHHKEMWAEKIESGIDTYLRGDGKKIRRGYRRAHLVDSFRLTKTYHYL